MIVNEWIMGFWAYKSTVFLLEMLLICEHAIPLERFVKDCAHKNSIILIFTKKNASYYMVVLLIIVYGLLIGENCLYIRGALVTNERTKNKIS